MTPEELRIYRRDNSRRWRAANPDRVKELRRIWRDANREKIREQDRRNKRLPANRAKAREATRRWYKANANKYYGYRQKQKYGLTPEQSRLILDAGCGICHGIATCIDHDHKTGVVRGGLCQACNIALGWREKLGEDWITLSGAYLEAHKKVAK